MRFFRQTNQIKHIRHAFLDCFPFCADCAHGERDVLIHRFAVNQPEILEHHAERAAQVWDLAFFHFTDIVVIDQHPPLGRPHLRGQELDHRRFAGTGRADQKDEFALVDAQVCFVHRTGAVIVHHGDIVHPYHWQSSPEPCICKKRQRCMRFIHLCLL